MRYIYYDTDSTLKIGDFVPNGSFLTATTAHLQNGMLVDISANLVKSNLFPLLNIDPIALDYCRCAEKAILTCLTKGCSFDFKLNGPMTAGLGYLMQANDKVRFRSIAPAQVLYSVDPTAVRINYGQIDAPFRRQADGAESLLRYALEEGARVKILSTESAEIGVTISYEGEEDHFEGEDCFLKAEKWLGSKIQE